jgi:hypothetical protein
VDAWESERNWWMHGRVNEKGGCLREWEKLVNTWEIETCLLEICCPQL